MTSEIVGAHSGSVTEEIGVEVFRDGDSVEACFIDQQTGQPTCS